MGEFRGQINKAGRPANSTNTLTRNVKKLIADIVEHNLETLQEELDQMKSNEKARIIISLLEHVSPKLRSVETNDVTEHAFKPISINLS
jgi:hypothetical protein